MDLIYFNETEYLFLHKVLLGMYSNPDMVAWFDAQPNAKPGALKRMILAAENSSGFTRAQLNDLYEFNNWCIVVARKAGAQLGDDISRNGFRHILVLAELLGEKLNE